MPYTEQNKLDFVVDIYSDANRAAMETGLPVEFIIAQSALETGWGKSVLPGSNNIFNIKTGRRWKGKAASYKVPEYVDNGRVVVNDKFRVYGSYKESIDDWINFVKTNKSLARLLASGDRGDVEQVAIAFQKAKYATDPDYAKNIVRTANGRLMKKAILAAKEGKGRIAVNKQSSNGTIYNSSRNTDSHNSGCYIVKPGDTLVRISRAHNVSIAEIVTTNPAITNINRICIGQKLVIPTRKSSVSSYSNHTTRSTSVRKLRIADTPKQSWSLDTLRGWIKHYF